MDFWFGRVIRELCLGTRPASEPAKRGSCSCVSLSTASIGGGGEYCVCRNDSRGDANGGCSPPARTEEHGVLPHFFPVAPGVPPPNFFACPHVHLCPPTLCAPAAACGSR